MGEITIKQNLRLCLIPWYHRKTRKGLFHCWGTGNNGTIGIVELEDGHIVTCSPSDIQFLDTYFDEYAWPAEENKDA